MLPEGHTTGPAAGYFRHPKTWQAMDRAGVPPARRTAGGRVASGPGSPIHDAAWAEMRRQLEYKSRLHGSVVTVRDPFYASSKICSGCGYVVEVLPLGVREWTYPACQTTTTAMSMPPST